MKFHTCPYLAYLVFSNKGHSHHILFSVNNLTPNWTVIQKPTKSIFENNSFHTSNFKCCQKLKTRTRSIIIQKKYIHIYCTWKNPFQNSTCVGNIHHYSEPIFQSVANSLSAGEFWKCTATLFFRTKFYSAAMSYFLALRDFIKYLHLLARKSNTKCLTWKKRNVRLFDRYKWLQKV